MYENSIIIVKKLVLGVQEFFNSSDFTFRKKLSPFHIAGHSGIIELFEKIFFSNNGDVNTTDSFGWKPLHFAAWRIIKKCNNDFEEFEDLWKQIINKAPIEALKQIGMESERLFWKKLIDKYHNKLEGIYFAEKPKNFSCNYGVSQGRIFCFGWCFASQNTNSEDSIENY